MFKRLRRAGMFAAIAVAACFQFSEGQTLAFPGAEGVARYVQGGRGGRVIEVTNLNDAGSGSFRAACEDSGARIVVFRVGGTITLESNIEITNGNITIAGQTAPGGGIALKYGGLVIKANQVIIRYIRVRPGSEQLIQIGWNTNPIAMQSNEGTAVSDIIVDHCSISWGTDDLIYIVYGTNRVTVQWSLLYECLECIQCGNKGLLLDAGVGKQASIHHNLLASTYLRWPQVTNGDVDFVNNVGYNDHGTPGQIIPVKGPVHLNLVGNYYKEGPNVYTDASFQYPSIRVDGAATYTSSSEIYVSNNYGRYWDGLGNSGIARGLAVPDAAIIWGNDGPPPLVSSRIDLPLIATTSPNQAYEDVLNKSGAWPRDAADARVVADVRNGTGSWPEDPSDVGGWPVLDSGISPIDSDHDGMPDSWETSNSLNPNSSADGSQDKDADGYTNVEEYLNELADALAGGTTTKIGSARPTAPAKTIVSRRAKQCPLDIFGRTISENAKDSKRKNLPREILDRKLSQTK